LFLATRHGKYLVGVLSVAIGTIFLLASQMVRRGGGSSKSERAVKRCETVIQRDLFLLLGSVALMLGAVYLVWGTFF